MVGQPEGDEEGVGDRPGAQYRRQHDVADKAGNARDERKAADRENSLDHVPFLSSPRGEDEGTSFEAGEALGERRR